MSELFESSIELMERVIREDFKGRYGGCINLAIPEITLILVQRLENFEPVTEVHFKDIYNALNHTA
jgi:hypothetical protein